MSFDFSNQNLQGRSFSGQDLRGACFKHSDVRGANFSNAILVGADFSNSKTGLREVHKLSWLGFSFALSALSGFIASFSGAWIGYLLSSETISEHSILPGLIAVLIVLSFLVSVVYADLEPALIGIALLGAISLAGSGVVIFLLSIIGYQSVGINIALAIAGSVAGSVAGIITVSVSVAMAVSLAEIPGGSIAGICAAFVSTFSPSYMSNAISKVVSGNASPDNQVSSLIAITVVMTASYVGWRTIEKSKGQNFVRRLAVALTSIGGTNFQLADLTNSNFSYSTLSHTIFWKAILTRTYWLCTKDFDLAFFPKSYLSNENIRRLVITGKGEGKNFDGLSMRGINIAGASLASASLIGSDLSDSNLQDIDLSRAKLIQTQLDQTDLSRACLTGTYIENWGITASTKLNNVECRYVYMRLPTRENPEPCRKPDNLQEEFKPEDFADFIRPLTNTLDLYHNQGVDPRAIAVSFKSLVENNPDAELYIVAMEVKGQDKFMLRARTAPDADKSKLNAEYFDTYQKIKELPKTTTKLLIAEKDERIRSLEKMVETALNQPKFRIEHNPGGIMSESINVDAGGSVGAVGGGDVDVQGVMNLGTISGTVTNTINQLQESSEPDAPKLADLLKQLKTAIDQSKLNEKDKAKALKHLDEIAKLGCDRANSDLRETTETALDALTGIFGKAGELLNSYLPLLEQIQQIVFPL